MGNQGNFIARVFAGKRFNWAAFGLIAGLILIAYSNTFNASFHFDDDAAISENHIIKQPTAENVFNLMQGSRPLVYLSLMLNYRLGALNPVGWHIFNILVHILNSFFVYLLILWTLSAPPLRARYAEKSNRLALFAGLLFAVHPIQTESVTYIISRTELLATFFYLATFLLFIKGTDKNKFVYYVGAGFTALCAMGSKEWAVTLPAVLMVYDFLFLAGGSFRKVLSRWKAYLLVMLAWGEIYHTTRHLLSIAQPGTAGMDNSAGFNISPARGITAWTYLLTSFNVIWTYIRLLFLPINQNLDYDYAIAKSLFEFPTLLSFVGHLLVVAGAFWLYIKKRQLLIPFGVAWFYIGLSPVQSFVPILDVIFEHRVYMPSIGFFLIFVIAYENAFEWFGARKVKQAEGTPG